MQPSLTDYSNKILFLLKSINKKCTGNALMSEEIEEFTYPQLLVLSELYHHPNITLNSLSEYVMLSKSTVSGIVDRLESQGAIIKERHTTDKRAINLSLSDKIMKKGQMIINAKNQNLAIRLKKLEVKQIEQIIENLELLDTIGDE